MERFASAAALAAATSLSDALCLPESGACSGVVVATLRDRAESVASFAGLDLPADALRFFEGPGGSLGVRVAATLPREDAALLLDAMTDGYEARGVDPYTVHIAV